MEHLACYVNLLICYSQDHTTNNLKIIAVNGIIFGNHQESILHLFCHWLSLFKELSASGQALVSSSILNVATSSKTHRAVSPTFKYCTILFIGTLINVIINDS